MNFRLFYHSLESDWNHGNAHFLRGIVGELVARGHDVRVFEPRDGWSRTQLVAHHGHAAIDDFHRAFPHLRSVLYDTATLDVEAALDDADIVVVHEWTDSTVFARIAEHRTRGGNYGLLFHDTHHRAVSDPDALARLPLERCDAVLAFGASLVREYRRLGWGRRAFVWHEAAVIPPMQNCGITQTSYPQIAQTSDPQITQITQISRNANTGTQSSRSRADGRVGDLVWVGNWGDDERARELQTYLVEPVRQLGIAARVYGVRYPPDVLEILSAAGIEFGGWIPNYRVPDVFAQFRVTVHIPRQPYVAMLPGIPTIRVFEALSCGVPLVSAPWDDCEELFRPGDFVMVHSGEEMKAALRRVVSDDDFAADLAARGLETIQARHTCGHRVDELLAILDQSELIPARVRQQQLTQEMR